jgi:type IV secretion system protein VirB2
MTKAVENQTISAPDATQANGRKTNYVAMAVVVAITLAPQFALAAGGNPLQSVLDGLIAFLNSGVMRSVAILAVISCGVAAYLGKISWELVMKIGGGIILTFGAAALVDQFSGYVG